MTTGYSGTPLLKKLGLKAGQNIAVLGAPEGYLRLLGPLPDDLSLAENEDAPIGRCPRLRDIEGCSPAPAQRAPAAHRSQRHDLGVLAQALLKDANGRDRRRCERHRSAPGPRRRKGGCNRRDVVGAEACDPGREQALRPALRTPGPLSQPPPFFHVLCWLKAKEIAEGA